MVGVLKVWLKEPIRGTLDLLFPNIHGDTTQLYAKVDLPSLQQLAMRWPGGEQ
jgi:hypothetical protein